MLVEFAAGRAKNVIVKHNFIDKIKNVAFLQDFPFTTPLRSMLVEFAPGTVKNKVWGQ